MKTSVVTPYAAYLRVYEPLAAFSDAQSSVLGSVLGPVQSPVLGPVQWSVLGPVQWSVPADDAARQELDPLAGAAVEHRQALAGLLAVPPVAVPAHESDQAFVLRLGGETYLCPWQTRLRSWAALEELRETVPDEVLDAFVPQVVIEQAEADFARWRADHPFQQPHILTATWHVPPRWFLPFMPRDRVLEVGSGGAPRRLYYRVRMLDARRRVARGYKVVTRAFEEGPLTEGVEDLGRWLQEFDPRSFVELDYGGLVRLVDAETLVDDQSAGDVQEALAALASGDVEGASAAYRRLLLRWRPVQELEHAS